MPKTAPVLTHLPADEDVALSGDVEVTCDLAGIVGEDPDDCTTHDHAHTGTVLISLEHLVYAENADSLLDEIAHAVIDPDGLGDEWQVTYTAESVIPGNVIVLAVSVNP